jgi:hypothetical protein
MFTLYELLRNNFDAVMNKTTRISIFVLSFILIISLSYIGFIFYQSYVTNKSIPGPIIDTYTDISKQEPICLEEEIINFAFYEDKPADFPVNNKFGLYNKILDILATPEWTNPDTGSIAP